MAKKVVCDRCGDDATVGGDACESFHTLKYNGISGFYTAKEDLCRRCLMQIARACEPQPRLSPLPLGVR